MHFFLYEIVARIVAIYLCYDCGRALRQGLVERKTAYVNSDFIAGLLMDWSNRIIDRDAAPIRYWITIGIRIVALAGCLFVAIFGWVSPDT
jgi:hypothetical protein